MNQFNSTPQTTSFRSLSHSVKVFFSNGEVRRFTLQSPIYLKQLLKESFANFRDPQLKKQDFNVEYQDSDGDWIVCENNEDFEQCLNYSSKNGLKIKIIFQ
eukprot:gene10639-3262_t